MGICFPRWTVAAVLALALGGCGGTASWSEPAHPSSPTYQGLDARSVADRIAAGDGSAAAAQALRAHGPAGLAAALDAYDRAVAERAGDAARDRLAHAVDVAAGQRDAVHTRLYWYTDLEEAKRAASASHRPILSLRMLGRLDEEVSCANSRFFRTTLYPNEVVGRRMREDFVLHWSSERPVPVVTIDFGDGRVVRRTITGNSIHYVLDAEGGLIDAIPGLYGPSAFVEQLERATDFSRRTASLPRDARRPLLAETHQRQLDAARADLRRRAASAGYFGPLPIDTPELALRADQPSAVPALVAIPMAVPKAMVEQPIARAIAADRPAPSEVESIPWAKLGSTLRSTVKLDDHARAVMRAKAPLDWTRGEPVPLDDAGFVRLVDAFENHVAEDQVKNELYFHAQIRRWLVADPAISLEGLNERVYEELFLTPATDPWLGLVPPVVYTGLQRDGF